MKHDDLKSLSDAFFQAKSDGQLFLAVEISAELLRRIPDKPIWQFICGDTLRRVGRLEEAEQYLRPLKPAAPWQASQRLIALGVIYEAKGLLKKALAAFRGATAAHPNDTCPWIYLGTFLMRRERLREAIKSLKRGLAAEGDLDEVHFNLGGCYASLDQLDEAVAQYAAAIAIDPNYKMAKNLLADIQKLKKFRSNLHKAKGTTKKTKPKKKAKRPGGKPPGGLILPQDKL